MPLPPDPLAPLLASIASCDSAFRLMELLMRFCRDQAPAYREWEEDVTWQADRPAAATEVRSVVATFGGMVFAPEDDPDTLNRIRTAVADYIQKTTPPPVVRAELLLRGLDHELTPQLRALYPDFHPGPLAPGQLFPVYWPNLKRNGWLPPDKLSIAPLSLSQPPGFLPKWALAPSADVFSGRQVEFVFPARTDVTPDISGPLRLGVGVLNATTAELTWEEDTTPPARFRDVRPRPDIRGAQVVAMCRVATLAAAEGVRLLVFPELCIDRLGAEEVFNHVAGLSNRPALVVIGSYHWLDGDGTARRNTCVAIRSGTPPTRLEHHKIAPFSYPAGEHTFREDIRPGGVVRVFVGTGWSVVLLICRDFLDTPVRQLVEALRPTFLCVPSFSSTTTPFFGPVEAVTSSAQTVAVFANGPVPSDRVVAVFGVPRTRDNRDAGSSLAREHVVPEPLPALPCLVVYDGATDAIRRLSC